MVRVVGSVPGVRGIYAIEPSNIWLDFAIETDPRLATRDALLRVLTPAELERVEITTSVRRYGLSRHVHLLR